MKELNVLRAALADARRRAAWEEYTIILRGIVRVQEMIDLAGMPTAKLPVVSRQQEARRNAA